MNADRHMKAAGFTQKYEDVDLYWPSCSPKDISRLVKCSRRKEWVAWPCEPGAGESSQISRTAVENERFLLRCTREKSLVDSR